MAVEAEDLAARLKAEFPHALTSGQVVAYYQPEVELSSGRVVAAESLARWDHPEFGTLPPAEAAGGSTRTPSRRPIPPSPDPGPGAAAGPATAVPPA
jgi:predicted signal transduction protein with EAL and GGDEF domain